MQRIGEPDGLFINGNPAANTLGTIMTAAWANAVQEELVGLILAGGVALSAGNNAQAQTALANIVRRLTYNSSVATGTANALVASFTSPLQGAAPAARTTVQVRAAYANTSATPTFTPAVDTMAPLEIVKGNNLPLVAGDISGAGHWLTLTYDVVPNKWVLQNPAKGVAAIDNASSTVAGISRFATAAEALAGALGNVAVTPTGLIGTFRSVTFTQNDYTRIPNKAGGLIIQWGRYSGSGTITVTLPVAFPTAAFVVIASQGSTGSDPDYVLPADVGLTSFIVRNANDGYFIAIGI